MRLAFQLAVFAASIASLHAPTCRAATDVIDLANSTRLEVCRHGSAEPGRLRPDPRLDDAARRISGGQGLEAATRGAGYRAKSSASIHVSTSRGDAGIGETLRRRFCDILADPDLQEIGAFRRGEDTWLVLARPLIPRESAADGLDERVLDLVNRARGQARRCGSKTYPAAAPLRNNPALSEAASGHARDMASRGRLGHEGSDGSQPADRATRAGYPWKAVAENVAAGQPSAEEAVQTWLGSPGHCRNLMDSRYSETGIAHAVNPDAEKGIYWVQVFGAPE